MSSAQNWFEVNKDGLSRLLEGRGKDRVITELLLNGLQIGDAQ